MWFLFRSSSLPPLDWPLPNQFEGLELRIEVQPRTHHRAHYETEGSRGAVKASPGGHPVVKVRATYIRQDTYRIHFLYTHRNNKKKSFDCSNWQEYTCYAKRCDFSKPVLLTACIYYMLCNSAKSCLMTHEILQPFP